MRICEYRISI